MPLPSLFRRVPDDDSVGIVIYFQAGVGDEALQRRSLEKDKDDNGSDLHLSDISTQMCGYSSSAKKKQMIGEA